MEEKLTRKIDRIIDQCDTLQKSFVSVQEGLKEIKKGETSGLGKVMFGTMQINATYEELFENMKDFAEDYKSDFKEAVRKEIINERRTKAL